MADETTGEFTEEERKKLKLPKKVSMVEVNGDMLLNLDMPVFPKKVQKFFPFNSIMNHKQKYFNDVLKEIKNKTTTFNGVFPIDIFYVQFPIKKEDEDECESE